MTHKEESPGTPDRTPASPAGADPAADADDRDLAADAAELAGHPKRWRALLFAHTRTEQGTCHSCSGVHWPCRPRRLAERAERLYRAARESET